MEFKNKARSQKKTNMLACVFNHPAKQKGNSIFSSHLRVERFNTVNLVWYSVNLTSILAFILFHYKSFTPKKFLFLGLGVFHQSMLFCWNHSHSFLSSNNGSGQEMFRILL